MKLKAKKPLSKTKSFRDSVEKKATNDSKTSRRSRVLKASSTPLNSVKRIGTKHYHLNQAKTEQATFLHKSRTLTPKYFKESFKELKNVTWPNRSEAFRLTVAVLVFSILFGVIVSLVDYGLDKLFKGVLLK